LLINLSYKTVEAFMCISEVHISTYKLLEIFKKNIQQQILMASVLNIF